LRNALYASSQGITKGASSLFLSMLAPPVTPSPIVVVYQKATPSRNHNVDNHHDYSHFRFLRQCHLIHIGILSNEHSEAIVTLMAETRFTSATKNIH
jgi:hypothetical protein